MEVGPGDLLYIPRGTPHMAVSLSVSLHLSILFTPRGPRSPIPHDQVLHAPRSLNAGALAATARGAPIHSACLRSCAEAGQQ
ncbi:JmjC domain-containing protein [Sphingomonas alpina]|uniref:JmjC domain-containing protein n=1 Tax=Sphingomonas alpina TaxID=653931 RepID=UPI0036F40B2D